MHYCTVKQSDKDIYCMLLACKVCVCGGGGGDYRNIFFASV